MAALIGLTAYQVNSMNPFPAASAPRIDFPFAGILVRAVNATGTTGLQLTTGQVVYSQVQLIATGNLYLVAETAQTIAAAS